VECAVPPVVLNVFDMELYATPAVVEYRQVAFRSVLRLSVAGRFRRQGVHQAGRPVARGRHVAADGGNRGRVIGVEVGHGADKPAAVPAMPRARGPAHPRYEE